MAAAEPRSQLDTTSTNQYDDYVEEFRRELELNQQETNTAQEYYPEPVKDIDEEIKITKKRKPVAKLDAERLLSERGLPELRRRAIKRIKLRGKGNEFEDIGNLLQMYQMWLDDLYPKAKFRDGLAMVEKIGHTKRMNVMRRGWIASTRPGQADEADLDQQSNHAEQDTQIDESSVLFPQANTESGIPTASASEQPEDDELDALLNEEPAQLDLPSARRTAVNPLGEDNSDQDELDALLEAETSTSRLPIAATDHRQRSSPVDEFADDEAAMNEMGIW